MNPPVVSATTPPPPSPLLDPAVRADVRTRTVSRRRRIGGWFTTGGLWAAPLFALVPLGAIVAVLIVRGGGLVSWGFLTGDIPAITGATPESCAAISEAFRAKYAISCVPAIPAVGPAILGTALSTLVATVIAVPLGIAAAVYLHEIAGPSRTAGAIRLVTDVMIGVPSIVMGMFVYTVWVVRYGPGGRSAFAAGLALAALMLPIVIRTSEEMLRLVPDELRTASLALGGRRRHGVTRVVLPAAAPGLVSGAMLAVARAAGETAPVLFTIGITFGPNPSITGGNTTLAQQIFQGAKSGDPVANQLAWGAAFTLVAFVLALSIAARLVTRRFTRNR